MPYLAARVPSDWQVTHVDEEAEDIDWTDRPDVVGITFHTPSAYHAYSLAARFRSRGACVVMGGPHVTWLPEEAAQHADVIFVGEAEGLWEEFLNGFYRADVSTRVPAVRAASPGGCPDGAQDALSPERLLERRAVCHQGMPEPLRFLLALS